MTASSSDSWILIALTIFVVLLLFYLSKKMICSTYGSSTSGSPTVSSSSSTSSDGRNYHNPDPSRENDDLGIDIPDYWMDNPCSGGFPSNTNNHRQTNNLNFGNSVTSPELRGREYISGSTTSSSSPPPRPQLLFPISIIASPDIERKTMLEAQLRNQIGKIVEAEREIQRLVQLLAIHQGLDWQSYIASARASLHHYHNHNQEILSDSSTLSSGTDATVESPPQATSQGTQASSINSSSTIRTAPLNGSSGGGVNSRISPSMRSTPQGGDAIAGDGGDDDDDDDGGADDDDHFHQNNVRETTPGGNRQRNESCSDFLSQNPIRLQPHHLSCAPCRCNMCRARMLMVRRMLSLSLVQPVTTAEGGGASLQGDFLLRRSLAPLLSPDNVHYRQNAHLTPAQCVPVYNPQSGLSHPSPQLHQEEQHHQLLSEDNPPAYEECVGPNSVEMGASCCRENEARRPCS